MTGTVIARREMKKPVTCSRREVGEVREEGEVEEEGEVLGEVQETRARWEGGERVGVTGKWSWRSRAGFKPAAVRN